MKFTFLFIVLLTSAAGCVGVPFEPHFESTVQLIEATRDKCRELVDNAPMAQKECFPLLTNRKILIGVTKISNAGFFRIEGLAGTERNVIWCEPSREDINKIMNDPSIVKVGQKYWAVGEFTRFNTGSYLDFYTIEKCQLTKFGN